MLSTTDPSHSGEALARWLMEVLSSKRPNPTETEAGKEGEETHLHFYRQLPDFIEALHKQEPQATVHFAPLIFHLASCHTCHKHYLDLYDALEAAWKLPTAPVPLQGTATGVIVPERMIGQLCQLLISQAEVNDPSAKDATIEAARSHLQLAIKLSTKLTQNGIRREAIADLVRVASRLANQPAENAATTYGTILEIGGGQKGLPVYRHLHPLTHERAEQDAIRLRSATFEGAVVQRGKHLILHLDNLDSSLREKQVVVSISLGTLIEPIRWLGGNPLALRSTAPVDAEGLLIMPLGETELRLSNIEERRMLEVLFLRLEIRATSRPA